MKRLILTADDSSAGAIRRSGHADYVIAMSRRFVWGPLPTDKELSSYLAHRSTQKSNDHWLDHVSRRDVAAMGGRKYALLELADRCDSVELWMDTRANDQLVLIWLLSYLRDYPEVATKIVLRHVNAPLFDSSPKQLANRRFSGAALTCEHVDIAHLAWRAFRSSSPRRWFDLLEQDLSLLPQLRRCVVEMLDELPGTTTGLGASQLRMLELLSTGYRHPFDLFPHHHERFQRRVYDYWEAGALLEELALAPVPAVSGLAEWPFTVDPHDSRERLDRYKASTLSLTPLGKAILAGEEDFARLNPVRRWWGGTELTDTNLWRWGGTLFAPDPEPPSMVECREPPQPIYLPAGA